MDKRKNNPQLFKPGQSGNPRGRQKGSRNALGEDFLRDLHADWQQHGRKVLADTREQNPGVYLKVVSSILPKELHHKHFLDDLKELSHAELQQKLDTIRKERALLNLTPDDKAPQARH